VSGLNICEADPMVAIKANFDGEKIVLPEALQGCPPQEVILIYQAGENSLGDQAWMKAQEASFSKAWDNDLDAAYDQM
jgi:hypothetical protein